SLKSGRKYLVKENYNEIIHLVIEYKQKLHHASPKIDDKKD
ncbi:MAG: flagellar FlbD family protein, partial [Candidatus Kapaibacteriota bacterium]